MQLSELYTVAVRLGPFTIRRHSSMKQISSDFWTVRGSFKLAGLYDVGTHMSVIRRRSGHFILLDSYTISGEHYEALSEMTDHGQAIDAILNVHPFHTLHCASIHRLFPHARLYGTRRHREIWPDLNWETGLIEDREVQQLFGDDLEFSVPEGIDFISTNPRVHTASVLARHRTSGIVHVDDTLNVVKIPPILRRFLPSPQLTFHPLLGKALQKNADAADRYIRWASGLARQWRDTPVVCAAHSDIHHLQGTDFQEEVLQALEGVRKTLERHRLRYAAH
ncbi:hypothetical protein [Granulibacter bethesdensis]|uniref:Uncharacterized protein n=1 Tax=Granulibacter bethesdensis (strain ATCC BAA-1260 / CGDNIH1) TaxID=391165 RepID=Q0BT23_GRABC|nr:hypothetical protein [Granulibacter bethesdensis]ABI62029.1 Hypothetical protein GbCGDNIH1_1131 [Granulibacter bethesdensis CGDNIH1]AHJ69075.1 Hypothetical protein GbCGDNIH2_1131 [Granulibacter bethesdensis]APH51850.1 Hypothetical protein GbCGDNIH5_1131 [Granulibacter bethesdensis]APH64541.1 Hypothetical protein GbCGDNIH1I4_1131 [Granulibacter bethesdensis]